MFHYNQSKLDSVVAGIGEWNYFVCLMDNSIRALCGDETNRITELGSSHPYPHPLPDSHPTLSTDSLQTNNTSKVDCRRAYARAFHVHTAAPMVVSVPKKRTDHRLPDSLTLQQWFGVYPGLLRLAGGLILRYYK